MTALLTPIVVALVAAAGAFIVARRTNSGKIGTSDATDLWAESQAIRRELRDEVATLRTQMRDKETECASQIASLQGQIAALRNHN